MNPEKLAELSAATIGRLLLGGILDAVEVAEFFLDRIEQHRANPVFITVMAERVRREAMASAARYKEGRPLGPLDGTPIAWKDLFDVAGSVTTAGSSLFRDRAPKDRDAPTVANLAAAGMVSLGKVNLTEFAFSGLGLNPHFGTPRNPHDEATPRIPGGSSSGSGVAVALGLSPCAMGSDTGGSVRIPAALNGVVGYKSSEGHIDKRGVVALSPTLDTVGPLVRTVEDCVLLESAMRGQVASAVRRTDLRGMDLLVAENVVLEELDDAVGANFEAALGQLSDAGARVTRRSLPLLDQVMAVTKEFGNLIVAEAYDQHHDRVEGPDVDKIDRRVVARIMLGKSLGARALLRIMEARKLLAAELGSELDGALLVMPTIPHTAPEIASLEADDELFHRTNLKTLRNTVIGNFLATCGLALPSGFDSRGLPTSILFSAPGGEDVRLLSQGLAIEPVLQGRKA